MRRFINRLKASMLFKTYIMIVLPVFLLLVTMLIFNLLYTHNYRKMLEKTYISGLTDIYNENEKAIQNTISGIHMLAYNKGFMDSINAKNMSEEQNSYITSLLGSIERGNSLVYNILIIDRWRNTVHSSKGRLRLDTFFKYYFNYENYSEKYWQDYRAPLSDVQILAPTWVNEGNYVSSIIPVVFTQIGEQKLSKLIIVNIDVSYILYKMNDFKFTPNSKFYVVNKQTAQMFSLYNNKNNVAEKALYDKITEDESRVFNYRDLGGRKNMVISLSPTVSILGYSCVAMIPFKDINKRLMGLMLVFLGFGVIAAAAALFIVYRSTRGVGNMFKNIAELFDKGSAADKEEDDVIKYIHSQIRETLRANKKLESKFSQALPLVMEKYLLNLLNQNDYYIDKQMNDNIKSFIMFEYDYFMMIIFKMHPTEKFYDEFTNSEYDLIKDGIYGILKEILSDSYITYIIPGEVNTLDIVLNLKDDTVMDSIRKNISKMMSMFDNDREYMEFSVGMGNIYPDISGLKRSYSEATNVLMMGAVADRQIIIREEKNKNGGFALTISDENTLYNYLISNHFDKAKEFVDEIMRRCLSADLSGNTMMQMLVQIFSVVFKVMRIQNISYKNVSQSDFDILTDIMSCTPNEAYQMLLEYMEKISDIMNTSHSKVDVTAIITYINESYCSELSLDILADKFDTSPKYVSKLIKDKLGISFVEYVAGLRINRAKELLVNTDKNISDIYLEVGFNNRNTFIRTFKNFLGITPSEYRNM